ncbi:3-galactosyl-N-acetylglucosaminide 4-alpha-L-fucosyltransferase FUT3-like [Oculina patagonica]
MNVLRRKLRSISCHLQLTRKQKKIIHFSFYTIFTIFAVHRIFHFIQDIKPVHAVDEIHRTTLRPYEQIKEASVGERDRTKLILVHTRSPFIKDPWGPNNPKDAMSYKFTDWDGTTCEESRCRITFDKDLLNISDAVVLHAASFSSKLQIKEITRNRKPAQRWVVYIKESPGLVPIFARWNGVFNWTATYRRDSDIFVPYGHFAPLTVKQNKSSVQPSDEKVNYAQGKDKMVTIGVSNHCGGYRLEFVRALMKHVDVSLFGRCADQFESNNTFDCPKDLGNGCLEELQRHKFYLAVENSLCVDYITEKYWRNSLERGLVPIVLGGARYSPEQAIPGSFINAADFDSLKDLADYLKYLDKNDTAYNQYFEWKSKYKIVKYQFWWCQLCKALQDPTKPPKTYHKISEFWGIKSSCRVDKERIENIISKG